MDVAPYALYSNLLSDIRSQIGVSAYRKIESGTYDWFGITFRERAAASVVASLYKKYESGMTKETQERALVKFLAVDSDCEKWVSKADQYGDDFLMGEFKAYLWKFWHHAGYPIVDHDYDVLRKGGVGPGASRLSNGGDFYTKLFSSRLSCTSRSLYHWYRRFVGNFPEWSNAERTRLLSHGEPAIVEGNRLSFVSKNDDISRSICTEPTLNMYFQLGFGSILSSRLEEQFGIRLETQQFKNRELARKGSLDGSYSTIDLSSASDSIGMKMLRECLPRDFMSFLERYRSPSTLLPNGKLHRTNMISTMGNGYTFPLQTVLFTCIVLSAFRLDGMEPIFPRGVCEGNFGVNGDDIVVPTRLAGKVLRLLHLLGFTPNKDKTFVEGPFRESCGGDYFLGRNLRGVYVKRLSEPQDYYSVINQLNLFSTRTGIRLSRAVGWLLSKVPFLPVPVWENDDSGIKVPFSAVQKQLKIDRDTQSIFYYAWTPATPPCIRISDRGLVVPRHLRRREFNLSGLFVSFLQGSIDSNRIMVKPDLVRYRRKRRIASNWDIPVIADLRFPVERDAMTIHLLKGWFDWERWKTAAYLNLFG